jgi:hypothetical protein
VPILFVGTFLANFSILFGKRSKSQSAKLVLLNNYCDNCLSTVENYEMYDVRVCVFSTEYIGLLNKSSEVSLMTYSSTAQSAKCDSRCHVWGAVRLSQPVDTNALPATPASECSLLTHIQF